MKNLLKSKLLLAALAVTVSIAIIIPSAVSATAANQGTASVPVGKAGHIYLEGSTTVGPIIQIAAPDYNSFKGSTVIAQSDILQNDSGSGRQAAIAHFTDIAMSSSKDSTAAGSGLFHLVNGVPTFDYSSGASQADMLNEYDIARDGVVIIVNSSVPTDITQITEAQIVDIYEGYITNWDQISGNSADNMAIVPRARIIGSGTRQSLSDQTKGLGDGGTGGTGTKTITFKSDEATAGDPAPAPAGHNLAAGIENNVIVNTGLPRELSNQTMHDDLNLQNATGQIGYVGLGFDSGNYIRSLKVVDQWNAVWTSSAVNIYSINPAHPTVTCYPLSRFLYLYTPNDVTPANASDISDFINWMKQTNGQGQNDVVTAGFLKLIPDQDVVIDNTIDVLDLIGVGNHIGEHGATPHWIRADVKADGVIDVLDLIAVGNWIGASIAPS